MTSANARLVIGVVDHGGQWTHREWRMLRYRDVDTRIIPNDTPLEELRELDEVAFVRFASVYRSFKDLDEFRQEIDRLSQDNSKNSPE